MVNPCLCGHEKGDHQPRIGQRGNYTPCNQSGCKCDGFRKSPNGRLADLPRFLNANGNRTLAAIVTEQLAKYANAHASLSGVLHQMEHGEASDFIDRRDDDVGNWRASADDLRWCREQLRDILKNLS